MRPDCVLVESSVRDVFLEHLVTATRRFAGAGIQPLLNSMHVDRVRRLLSDHGGSVVQGGGVDLATRMVEPTIVLDPVPSSALPAEEIFAPILPVVSAIYLFTGSRALRERVLAGTRSGSVVVNDVASSSATLIYRSVAWGRAGWGVYHGR